MRVALFCHSLSSDWNHGNAHFLRGVCSELSARGHRVDVFEPRNAWSVMNLVAEAGEGALEGMRRVYPTIRPIRYDPSSFVVEEALEGVDLVLVHEWNDPSLVARIGRHRLCGGRERLLFHDTHHRMATAPEEMRRYDLSGYDGVLAFGRVIRDLYLERSLIHRAWVWHEAADIRVFYPKRHEDSDKTLIWVGNWGDEERTREISEYLLEPALQLKVDGTVHGVRYPAEGISALSRSGLEYRGWIANYLVPDAFSKHRVTVHIPRRPYAEALPGIPTIRPFEALACGIPLVSAPWDDVDNLFVAGRDYLLARDGAEMKKHLRDVLEDESLSRSLAESGWRRIGERHTCAHRVDELLRIARELGVGGIEVSEGSAIE